MSFARTKIQAPRPRPGWVERPALEARLDAALQRHRLVLFCAPAGFGKTAALTRQIARLPPGSALAWVSCDEDDDLQRLLGCICAALEPFDPPWRSDPDVLAARATGTRAQRREAADELLNVLAACETPRGVIVLDDLHRIQDPGVFEFIDLLLPGLPAQWTLVLSGRETPPLALPRLRVQGELAEFRETDLQFDTAEVEALLQATPGAAQRVAAPQLLARTQGWAVGLRLALNTLSDGRAAAGALRSAALDRHVFDYLAAEVLQDMPAELRRFMLRCSVLPELNAERCRQVSQDERAAHWLEQIEQRGLFVTSLEGPELTLRLHDLFRDFLEDRLLRELPDEVPALLQRAADGEEDTVRRIAYLLRAGAIDAACTLLCAAGPALITQGVIAPVLRMIEQFPPAQRDGSRLQLLRGLGSWAIWDFDAMCEAMRRAANGYAQRGDTPNRQLALAYEAIALSGASRLPAADVVLDSLLAEPLARRSAGLRLARPHVAGAGRRAARSGGAALPPRAGRGRAAGQHHRLVPGLAGGPLPGPARHRAGAAALRRPARCAMPRTATRRCACWPSPCRPSWRSGPAGPMKPTRCCARWNRTSAGSARRATSTPRPSCAARCCTRCAAKPPRRWPRCAGRRS